MVWVPGRDVGYLVSRLHGVMHRQYPRGCSRVHTSLARGHTTGMHSFTDVCERIEGVSVVLRVRGYWLGVKGWGLGLIKG